MMRVLGRAVVLACMLLPHAAAAHAPRVGSAQAKPALGGDFELQDARGGTFRLEAQRGRLVLIYFGYTSCPDVCPSDLLQFREILASLGEKRDRVLTIFISLDPARDTPQRLAEYAATFSPAILPLTGSESQLRRVVKAYGSNFSYIGRGASTAYTVDHPANLYVVDGAGRLARILPYGTPTAEVIKAITPILE